MDRTMRMSQAVQSIEIPPTKTGTALEEEIKRYLHDPARFLVMDEMQIQRVDWHCPYCGSLNHAGRVACTQCGGSV